MQISAFESNAAQAGRGGFPNSLSVRAAGSVRVMGAAFVLATFAMAGPVAAQSGAASGEDIYEIVRASEDRIWRLNKQTGDVSVCTLDGDQLICTDTDDAANPPKKTYEQIEEEKAAAEAEREAQERAEQERQLTILDRMLDMVRELLQMSMEPAPEGEKL